MQNVTWHALCNMASIRSEATGPNEKQGVFIMFIAKFQTATAAFVGALFVATLFVGAAVPVTPIA